MKEGTRDLSIDLLKALGVISFVIAHPVIWILVNADYSGIRYTESQPVFDFLRLSGYQFLPLMLSSLGGMSIYLYIKEKKPSWGALLLRAGLLLLLGFGMNFIVWGIRFPADTFDWDFLHFFALSMVITYPLVRGLPSIPALAGLVILGTIALIFSSSYPLSGFIDFFLYPAIIGDPSGENCWPLCPWYSLVVVGVLIAFLCHVRSPLMKFVPFFGGVFLGISIATGHVFLPVFPTEHIWGATLFKPSMFYVLGIIGVYLLLFSLVRSLLERFPEAGKALQGSLLIYFARGILWIYLGTTILGHTLTQFILSRMTLDYAGALILIVIIVFLSLALGYFVGKAVTGRKTITYY